MIRPAELRKLLLTGFFSVLFAAAMVNQVRGADRNLAWISAVFLAGFLVWFIVTVKNVVARLRLRHYSAGDLLSVITEKGDYGVAKVLYSESSGVHVRVYAQRFPSRPSSVSSNELSVEPYGPEYDNAFSIGHMPLSWETFTGWSPQLISRDAAVTEDELEGFRMWQEAQAGFF